MPDFFVSYNKADREWAEWIAWQLEDAGYSTKIQAWDIRPGSDFIDEMNKAIIETERTIAVLSPDSLVSRYAKMEWDATIKKGPNKLLFACISKCRPEGVYGPIIGFDLALDEETAKEPCLMQWQKLGVSSLDQCIFQTRTPRRRKTRARAFPELFRQSGMCRKCVTPISRVAKRS